MTTKDSEKLEAALRELLARRLRILNTKLRAGPGQVPDTDTLCHEYNAAWWRLRRMLGTPLNTVREEAYAEQAKLSHHRDGELEFDDKPVVSMGGASPHGEDGAYISCWRWVDREDLPACSPESPCLDTENCER